MGYKENELKKVLRCSFDMLEAAEDNRWEEVFSLEEQRSSALKELFSLPFTKEEKLKNNSRIREILNVNKKLETVTAQAREAIRDDAESISKGRHAVGMYAQNAG